MKNIPLLLFLLFSTQLFSQNKYYTKSGTLVFESSVASFEEIKATNNKVTAILKDDGKIAALVLTKGFRFKIALMEEHFNENHIESSIYPKAKFSGIITDFSIKNLTEENKKHTINGKLIIRNISKKITISTEIKMVDNFIYITSNFTVTPEDFNIKIPNIVRKKIAKAVDISLSFKLKKK